MSNEMNNQQMQNNPQNTSFQTPQANTAGAAASPTVPQSDNGKWVPVDPNALGFTVSGSMNQPVQGPDGAYYCISNSQPEYSSIQANHNNAVPTPSSLVQLPPIVQPISLVPYASQNQPLLQYDPNYRPQEPEAPQAPKYRLKPYRGLSLIQILLSAAIIVLMVMMLVINGQGQGGGTTDWSAYQASGLDTVYGLMALLGLGSMTSVYFDKLLSIHFADGLSAGFSADWLLSSMYVLIPAFVAIIVIVSIILLIYYLVKIGKMKSPRAFSVGAFLNLLLSGCIIAMIFGISTRESMELTPGIFVYVVAGISLLMLILPYFARKNAYVLDETALKKVYILDEPQKA
ncbi:MAG: hypothetical protein ACOCWI_01530 [Bacillota bacterium]